MKKKILVTGGLGYIGSHLCISLLERGFVPIIIDNFTNSHKSVINNIKKISKRKFYFYNIDLLNKKKLDKVFDLHKIYAVIHCASLKSVSESIKEPAKYFSTNLNITLNLIECMKKRNIFRLIFSSSASVYNNNISPPFNENNKIGKTTNAYATSKYLIEKILNDLSKFEKKWKIGIARYFNAISNHESGLIYENPKNIPSNLFPYLINVLKKKYSFLKIYGSDYNTKDGTCIRDYIHVMDLAYGHILILKKKFSGVKIYNFGSGKGFSVLEVLNEFKKQTNKSISYKFCNKREGDIPISICSTKKVANELGWRPRKDLKKSINDIILMLKKNHKKLFLN
jgi:UDP-glucose 4-epimerase